MHYLANLVARRPGRLLLVVLLVFGAAGAIGGSLPTLLTGDHAFDDPASQSIRTWNALARTTGAEPTPSVLALVRLPAAAGSAAADARLASVGARLRAVPGIAAVTVPAGTAGPAIARDGRSALVTAAARSDSGQNDVGKAAVAAFAGQPDVSLGGVTIATYEVGKQVTSDLGRAELLAFPLLFLLALWAFRGPIAAALPLAVGGVAITVTFAALRGVDDLTPLSIFAVNLVTGLGLGLAIDYSLLLVTRYREHVAADGHGRAAAVAALRGSARTVLFSAVTVSAALLSLLVFPQRFLRSMGIAGAIVALVAAVAALVIVPALLALLGRRLDWGVPQRFLDRSAREATATDGAWARLARAIGRRPATVAVVAAVLLIALGLPFRDARFGDIDASVLPAGTSARVVDETLAAQFPAGRTTPLIVVAPAVDAAAVAALSHRLGTLPGVAAVAAPVTVPGVGVRLDVYPRAGFLSADTEGLVHAVRNLRGAPPLAVSGAAAGDVDLRASIAGHLVEAVLYLLATTLLVLFAMTRSVVLPIKAVVMNALTVSAAMGFLVLVFQAGRLTGLLDYRPQGFLEATQPVLVAALAFGLSTDYGVFLLERIRQEREAGRTDREAVAVALQRTGRTVTAAAILFACAMAAFSTSQIVFVKELGLGTAVAVLVDAMIVRTFLVPALMTLLGRANWWAPRWLGGRAERCERRAAEPALAPSSR